MATRMAFGWLLLVWLLVALACGSLGPPGNAAATTDPPTPNQTAEAPPTLAASTAEATAEAAATPAATQAGALTARALSSVSVELEWPAIAGATGYQIEVGHGEADLLAIAETTAAEQRYTHFVAPGSVRVIYRLSAIGAAGLTEVASATIDLPTFEPAPLIVMPVAATASAVGFPDISALPTIDPFNPDPDALATVSAFMEGFDPNAALPTAPPVHVQQAIGPEGGVITLIAPNAVAYTLTVPAGALDEVTMVYLTPIGEVTDLPFAAGLAGAVKIHPPIPFAQPVTLTLALPAPPANDGSVLVGFTVSSLSHELALAPGYRVGENVYELDVAWGDTFGLAAASRAEVQAQTGHIPNDPGEQIAQQLAALRAFSGDTSPEGEFRLLAQLAAGVLQQINSSTVQAGGGTTPKLAAPARQPSAAHILASGAGRRLWEEISRADEIFSNERQPNTVPGVGVVNPLSPESRRQIIAALTPRIKQFLDEHQGCRSSDDFHAQALIQMLKAPGSSFQRLLAIDYASRFGPPADLKECVYQLHIVSSEATVFADVGDAGWVERAKVHSNPFPLKAVGRGATASLRGVGTIFYEEFTIDITHCPPTLAITNYPDPAVWITDLRPIFDSDDQLVNFALVGVIMDLGGQPNRGSIATDTEDGVCRVVDFNPSADQPDTWGVLFAGFHNPGYNSDTWVITGGQSYVATGTADDQVGGRSATTTMLLTAKHPDD